MEIFTVTGSEYETGVQVGRLFAQEMAHCASTGAELLQRADIAADFAAVKAKLEKDYPGSLAHLAGRADGAGVARDAYLLYVCGEVHEDRCTDIMARTPGGGALLGHNEDGEYTLGNCELIRYEVDGFVFYDFSATDALPGASILFNQHGLVFTMNYMQMENRDTQGIPVWFVLREAANAKNVDEVVDILTGRACASGFNMNAVDYATGRIFNIEGQRGDIDVEEVTDRYVHTNHFLRPRFDEHFSYDGSNTLYRLAKARELLGRREGPLTLEGIKEVLYYKNESYYNSILETPAMKDSFTACTLLYSTETRRITIHDHLRQSVLDFDLAALVAEGAQ